MPYLFLLYLMLRCTAQSPTFYFVTVLLLIVLIAGRSLKLRSGELALGAIAFITLVTWIGCARSNQSGLGTYQRFGGVHHISISGGTIAVTVAVILSLMTLVFLYLTRRRKPPHLSDEPPRQYATLRQRLAWRAGLVLLCGGYFFFLMRPYYPWATSNMTPVDIATQGDDGHDRLVAINHVIRSGTPQDVLKLIDNGLDLNELYINTLPIITAARNNAVFKLLLENGADPNLVKGSWPGVLHGIVLREDLELATCAIDHGADVNLKNTEGSTPLHTAAYYRLLKAAQFLIDHGADINATNSGGFTSLDLAERKQDDKMKALLRAHGGVPGSELEGP